MTTNANDLYTLNLSEEQCVALLESIIWQGNPHCPYCNSVRSTPINSTKRYHCNSCNTAYSIITQSIFHNTKIDLNKWFTAILFLSNSRSEVSVRKLATLIKVNKDTAGRVMQCIRDAKQHERQRHIFLKIVDHLESLIRSQGE